MRKDVGGYDFTLNQIAILGIIVGMIDPREWVMQPTSEVKYGISAVSTRSSTWRKRIYPGWK